MLRTELIDVLHDESRDLRAFVAEDDSGELPGIVALEQAHDDRWEVAAIGVSINHRRIGVATALIKFGVASSPARNSVAVRLLVHERNVPMRRLMQQNFDAVRAADPGMSDYDVYAATPATVIKDLRAAMAKTQRRSSTRQRDISLGRSLD